MTKTLIPAVVRVLLGALFLVFGANKLVPFMPMPELPAAAGPFVGGLASTGYFFPLLGSIEVVMGALLISGRFVPLALTVLAPDRRPDRAVPRSARAELRPGGVHPRRGAVSGVDVSGGVWVRASGAGAAGDECRERARHAARAPRKCQAGNTCLEK